jgi:HEAT repeat protein
VGEEEESDPGIPEALGPTPPFQPKLPPDLAAELETFAESHDLSKKESADRIRKQASVLRKAKDHRILGELISVLAEGGVGDGEDDEALKLARDLTTPTEASFLVARLGATREEAERNRLATVIARTGREGAAALADALGESRDRSERRAFLNAMVTLGPLALDMAKGMVEDARWFVVRNGVAILGELGGDEAVAYITGTLANEDPRVRKESVASLAKVGGKDAVILILGMLDDPAPEVRGAGCRSLGLLGSERALKPLIKCLKDRDFDVQVEALQALGRIGDPGAVQAVRRMALGGFFSRPPRDVRLAAFRALAAIGTPEAIRIVEKGAGDGDEIVSTLARSLSSRR